MKSAQRLANRFGKTYHISYLRKRMERLRARDPEPLGSYEEWLIKVAEKRANKIPSEPSTADVANEELVVTLLLLENIDRPGLLGSAVLLLSRLSLDEKELASLAKQEHVDFLLSELRPRPPI